MDTTELLALPLAKRLEVMEALWDSLSRGDSAAFPSPAWHEPLLATRALALDQGTEHTSDWSEAKARIRARTGST
jgi:hypothetical protein